MNDRTPQLDDDVILELKLRPSTEEWAEEMLEAQNETFETERTDDALIVRYRVGGNCNAIVNASTFLSMVEDALRDGDIDVMEFTLTATTEERKR